MAKYDIDGQQYEIDDDVDLKSAVAQIRQLPEHTAAQADSGHFAFNPNPAGMGSDRSIPQLAQDAGSSPYLLHAPSALVGAGETALSGVTNLAGTLAQGAYNIGTGFQGDMTPNSDIRQGMTYQPRTDYGQLETQVMGEGFNQAFKGAGAVAKAVAPNRWEAGARTLGEAGAEAATYAWPFAHEARAIGKRADDAKAQKLYEQGLDAAKHAEEQAKLGLPYVPDAGQDLHTEPTAGAREFGIGNRSSAGASDRGTPFSRASLPNMDPLEPQPTETPTEGGANFPLRQEVLNDPKVKEVIDSYRSEMQRMEEEGAPEEDKTTLRQGFGEYMKKYGISTPEEATGLRIPLYDPKADALPIERVQRLSDRPGRASDWNKREPTAFDLADFEEPSGKMKLQKGYVDPRMFLDGYKFVRDALDKNGDAIKILGFTRKPMDSLDHLPDHLKQFVEDNTAHAPFYARATPGEDVTPPRRPSTARTPKLLTLIGMDKDGNPHSFAEFQQKGDYVESDWSHTMPGKEGRGLQTALYNAIRSEGSDIRASSAQTPQGRAMWRKGFKDMESEQTTDRPILKRFSKTGDEARSRERTELGATKYERGSVSFGQTYAEFAKDFKKQHSGVINEAVLRSVYEQMQGKVPPTTPKFESEVRGNAKEAIGEVPGMQKELDGLTPHFKPIDEVMPLFKTVKDIAGDIIARAGRELQSGTKIVARYNNNPIVKYYADHQSAMEDAKRFTVDKILYHPDTGVVANFDKLTSQLQIGLSKLIHKYEGKKTLTEEELIAEGMTPQQRKVYNLLQDSNKFMLDKINGVRSPKNQINARPGYFPGKLLGDWYTKIHAPDEENPGKYKLIGIHSFNHTWSFGKTGNKVLNRAFNMRFMDQIMEQIHDKHPDWKIGGVDKADREAGKTPEVTERLPMTTPIGSSHAMNVFGDLHRALEENDPRAKVLSSIISDYNDRNSAFKTGLLQHLKFKKGIFGMSGKDEYRSDLENAHDSFKAYDSYIKQAVEFSETRKLQPTISKLLDPEELPNVPNVQKYIAHHWDVARGIIGGRNSNAAGYLGKAMNDSISWGMHQFGLSTSMFRRGVGINNSQMMYLLLGYNSPRFLIAQLSQPNQFVFQNLTALKAKGADIGYTDMVHAWGKGVAHMVGSVNREAMEPSARAALQWAEDHRIVEPRMFENIQTELQKNTAGLFSTVNGQRSIRWVEAKTRIQAFMTFHELLKKAGMTGEDNYNLAGDMTRHTMVDYRPSEKPLLYRDLGIVGEMISPLTTFKHNYYSQMAVAIKELTKNPLDPRYMAPLAIMLGTQMAFSGLLGLPGREEMDALIHLLREANLVPPDTHDVTQAILQSNSPNYITHGVSAITGLDMSPTFSASSLLPDQGWKSVAPLVTKDIDIDIAQARILKERTKSSVWNMVHAMLPNAAQGLEEERAMNKGKWHLDPREYVKEGVNLSPELGNRMKGGERLTPTDMWARRFGLRGIEQSKEKTKMFEESSVNETMNAQKARLAERAMDAIDSGDDPSDFVRQAVKLGMTPNEFVKSLKDLKIARMTTSEQRFRGIAPKSYGQMYKLQRLRQYQKDSGDE